MLPLLGLVVACTDEPRSGPGGTSRSVRVDIPLPGSNRIDILLVVDNSPGMSEQRDRVRAHAAGLAEVLGTLSGGMPDVHIGVVGTDVRVPGDGNCEGTDALRIGGAAVTGAFVSDRPFAGQRQKNYSGELATVLSTMADLGSQGCAFPRPFEAAKRALSNTVENAGFLRTDAQLYVIYMATGHDYSTVAAAQYAAELKALKSDPSKVMISTLYATDPPFAELLAQFPNRSSSGALAAAAPSDAFVLLASLVKVLLGDTCWNAPLADLDPAAPGVQAECTAQLHTAEDDFPMKRCAPGLTDICYSIDEDLRSCPESGLRTRLENTDDYRVAGNTAIIECLVEATP